MKKMGRRERRIKGKGENEEEMDGIEK